MLKERHRDVGLLVVVALAFLLVGGYYFTGLYCSDDTRYLLGAMRIATGESISTVSLAERRVMFLLPAAALHAAGRDAELLIAPYLLFFVGTGCAGYLLARKLLPRAGALVAMLLAAAQPALFLHAGAMLPDIPSTFFIAVALLLLCFWLKAQDPASGRIGGIRFAAGVGAAMAASFTIKESGMALMAVPLVVMGAALWGRRPGHKLATAGALLLGFAGVLVLEALVFRLTAGHWYSSLLSLSTPHDMQAYMRLQGTTPLARLGTLRMTLGPYTTVLFLLAGVATLHLLWTWYSGRLPRVRALAWLAVALCWLWPMLAFTFGTVSLTQYLPPVIQQRYYAPAIVPAAVLVAHLMLWVGGARSRAAMRIGTVPAALLVVWFLSAPYGMRGDRGLIYGAGAKEAFLLARDDAARRYPGVPLYDVESGWSTDLGRCRALLVPTLPNGHRRLAEALRSGGDRRGRFRQPELADMPLPFLVAGHGDFLGPEKSGRWSAELLRREAAGELVVNKVGRYGRSAATVADRYPWLPRTSAVVRAEASGRPQHHPAGHGEDSERAEYVDLYLVGAPSRRQEPVRLPPLAPGASPGDQGP